MKYKALMLDVDGTIVSYSKNEILPSKKITRAIKMADEKIHVGLATSRPLAYSTHLLEHLKLSSPCIISGGAQIYDPIKKIIVYEKNISKTVVHNLYKIVNKYNLKVLDDGRGTKGDLKEAEIVRPTQIWLEIEDQSKVEEIFSQLSLLPSVSVHKIVSRFDSNIEIILSHTEATKQHGILKVAKILGIDTREIIGVGDGDNDFPLLMACGLKVAMGNSGEDLKSIADYVAPTVEEDGVADVIEKFIL